MLTLENMSVETENGPLLVDINLRINPNEIHAIIGPKNSGKSALAHAIAGHYDLELTSGMIYYNQEILNDQSASERSKNGIYISFQHPPEFLDLTNWELFKESRVFKSSESEDLKLRYDACSELLGLGSTHGDRFNDCMTPSSVKINELIFMLLSNPKFVILDEIDEDLSDEEINLVGAVLRDFLKEEGRSSIVITKNKKLLDIIQPTNVHIMTAGEIQLSGQSELYKRIVEDGYTEF